MTLKIWKCQDKFLFSYKGYYHIIPAFNNTNPICAPIFFLFKTSSHLDDTIHTCGWKPMADKHGKHVLLLSLLALPKKYKKK